jgi:hypothetical protein
MKKARVTRRAFNINERIAFLDGEYHSVIWLNDNEVTPTGLLVIGKLHPLKIGMLPTFIFRWDEKSDAVDIDIEKKKTSEVKEFIGHHTCKISSIPRIFKAKIVWKSKLIYEGQITFNLGFERKSLFEIGMNSEGDQNC